jgi:hypothetical protein
MESGVPYLDLQFDYDPEKDAYGAFHIQWEQIRNCVLGILHLYTDAKEAKGLFLNEIVKVFVDMFYAKADGSDANGCFQVTLGELKTSRK